MSSSTINRRNLLKKGAIALGAIALAPQDLWAKTVQDAQRNQHKFLYTSPHFNEFTPPSLDEESLKAILRANENPYGPPAESIEAFKAVAFQGNRYAWKTLRVLVDKIVKQEGIKSDQVIMGPGSSDLLEKVGLVFFKAGGNVVSADPSYMSLIRVAKAAGGNWKSIKLLSDCQHDLDAMAKAVDQDTQLVYICNPNNPTGSITNAKKLRNFCIEVSKKVPVYVDEAYIELSDNGMKDSMVSLIAEGHNVLVGRTFSKIHGMAGLRIGYLMGQKDTLARVNDITRGGMGITGPSIAAAASSLDNEKFLSECKSKIKETREYTFQYLKARDFKYLPSQTNFVIFEIPMEGDKFLKKIYDKQVAVRAFKFWDKNWCRVSMGTMEEMKLFTQAIDEIFV